MKKLIIFVIVAAAFLSAVFYFLGRSGIAIFELSADQAEVRELFGAPSQFEISYLPRGEAGEFARFETWYYPGAGKAISFLGGKIFASDDFSPPPDLPATALKPENFTFDMDYKASAAAVGAEPVPFDFPGLTGDNLNTYISVPALFVIENGYLTYFKTIGLLAAPSE